MKIKEFLLNTVVDTNLVVLKAEIKKASNGDYLVATLSDGESDIVGKFWKYDKSKGIPDIGKVINVRASVGEYNGKMDLNMYRWVYVPEGDVDVSDFMKHAPDAADCYMSRIGDMLNFVQEETLKQLVFDIFEDYAELFSKAPAARGIHHNYVAGLLQHILEVTQYAINIVQAHDKNSIQEYDLDLIVVGAILHDLGKLRTYCWNGFAIEYTEIGKFMEHIPLGIEMLEPYMKGLDVSETRKGHLKHIILAHHGKLEWGSPVAPLSPEAWIVHTADLCSARLNTMDTALEQNKGTWTPKIYPLGTSLYNSQVGED